MSRVKPILVHLSEVSGRLKSTKSLAVASDFDGTRAEIRPHPTEASIHPRARRALESLNTQPRARVAVVSGRPLRELSPKVALPGVALFGVFGQERSVDGRVVTGTAVEPAALPGDLRTALQSWCEEHPSTWIEEKGFAITVHYRQLPPRLQAAFAAGVRRRLASWRGRIRTFSGKKAFEILPMDSADKATALRGCRPRWTSSGSGCRRCLRCTSRSRGAGSTRGPSSTRW